jgi:hypothetical protein
MATPLSYPLSGRVAYCVEGKGEFPRDMLRREGSQFLTALDETNAGIGYHAETRRVMLAVHNVRTFTPNVERWKSFGWQVVPLDHSPPPGSLEEIQWRNIRKVVKRLADHLFDSPQHPNYGTYHVALTTSLTAKDGVGIGFTELEPLVAHTPEVVTNSEHSSGLTPVCQACQGTGEIVQHESGREDAISRRPCEVCNDPSQTEDLSGYGAQLLEENGRKVLSYWPYCSKCCKPFEFEKDEPFASCGCPGSTEWGDPRPASWVQPPASNVRLESASLNLFKALIMDRIDVGDWPPTATKALEELGAATRGK